MALKIRKDIFHDHISTAASFYKVGDIMARMEKYQDAKDLFLQAWKMHGSLKLIGNFSQGGKAPARRSKTVRSMNKMCDFPQSMGARSPGVLPLHFPRHFFYLC
ncbi:hypothetical protein QQZ08_003543 [Neonectria magnoliae]|uniref:Uncharacterized protein n=1 Tax=Neonectria magnoliae TaxID=2732573 RepID=A0ABR1I9D1_9HYPO